MKVISCINQKGGVGKTTTTHALGIGLANQGYKVLFIDLDPQGNLSFVLDSGDEENTIFEVLTEKTKIQEAIIKREKISMVPSSTVLSGIEPLMSVTGKEYKLKESLESLKGIFDYIVIDTPPSLDILTINALTTSDYVIIPTQADIFSLIGINNLNDTIQAVKKYCNPKLEIKGILLTRYNARSNITKDMTDNIQAIADMLNTKLFNTKIRENVSMKESQTRKRDIFDYSKKSNASIDYSNFVNEFLNKNFS